MKKKLETKFSMRQYMLAKDFEIFYYNEHYQSVVESHSHDYYEFYFFLEGDVSQEIENKLVHMKFGDIVIIPPGIKHRAVIHDTSRPYRRFVFWISKDYCTQLVNQSIDYGYVLQQVQCKKKYIFHNDQVSFNAIQSKIYHLLEEIHTERFGKTAKIAICVSDLMLEINRNIYEQEHIKNAMEGQNLYERLMEYIDDHLSEELSLDLLAKAFYVNKYHIAHVFKDYLGISVHQYIMKKRLSACHDAIQRQEKISEVFQQYGFKEYTSFFRAFKKEYGMSPKEFQAICRHE